jgi:hypothetical protein
VADTDNGALRVAAAARLLPHERWPEDDFQRLFEDLQPQAELTPDQAASLQAELAPLGPALTEARRLERCSKGRFAATYLRNPFLTLLPRQAQPAQVAWLLTCDSWECAWRRDLRGAVRACRAAFNAGRAYGDEPLALSQLDRVAIVRQASRAVERLVGQGELTETELADWQRLLEAEDQHPGLEIAVRGERALQDAMWEALAEGTERLDEACGGPGSGAKRGWLEGFEPQRRATVRGIHAQMLALTTEQVAIARMSPHQRDAALRAHETRLQPLQRQPVVLLMPSPTALNDQFRAHHALLRSLRVALAAERYRLRQGKWPDRLQDLVPGLLEEVPMDPFDGKPLRGRRLRDGYAVYSVGANGNDDGGNLDRGDPRRPGTDLGVRLWDVGQRRQPPRPAQPEPANP